MSQPVCSAPGRVGAFFLLTLLAASAGAAELLFSEPRHFVREIDDPVAHRVLTIDQYCEGNRVVVISGDRVTLTDYTKQEVLEIDRGAGTWSTASFDELARAQSSMAPVARDGEWSVTETQQTSTTLHRTLPLIRLTNGSQTIEIATDDTVTLSRGAFDVLLGAAWPDVVRPEHELIARATRRRNQRVEANGAAGTTPDTYAMPLEQRITFEAGGERVTIRNRIVRMSSEPIPADALVIPAGAKRVEPHAIRLARELQTLDRVVVPVH